MVKGIVLYKYREGGIKMKKAIIGLGVVAGVLTYKQNPLNLVAIPTYFYALYKCYIEFKNA